MAALQKARKLFNLNLVAGNREYSADNLHLESNSAKEANLKRSEKIRLILDQALKPLELEVIDESGLHAGHSGAREGGETHYRVEIVSAEFVDKSRVSRERLIHTLLGGEFSDGLHALSIKARAPNE